VVKLQPYVFNREISLTQGIPDENIGTQLPSKFNRLNDVTSDLG